MRVIPTAQNANVSIEQLSAAYVEMTKNGVSVNESTTYINSMLNEMSKSGTKVDKTLKQIAGKSFPELMKEGKSVGDVLAILDDHAKKNNLSLGDIFGSAEAAKAGLILASEGGSKFNDTLGKLKDSAGSTDKAFKTMSETTEFKFKQAMQQAKNALMQFGTAALPTITKVIEKASGMIEKFSELSPTTQEWIVKIGLAVAALGPFLSVLGNTISGIGKLGKGFVGAGKMLGLFGKGASATTTVTAGLGKAASITGGALAEVAVTSAVTGKGIAGVGTAAATAGGAKGIGALVGGLGGFLSAAAPFLIAGGALVGTCVVLQKSFQKTAESARAEIIPSFSEAVDSMEGLSDKSKEVVKSVNDEISKIEQKIIVFQADGSIAKEEISQLSVSVQNFIDNTIQHLREGTKEGKEELSLFYASLTEEEKKNYDESIKNGENANQEKAKLLEGHKKRIQEIEKQALKEGRELNKTELEEIRNMYTESARIQLENRLANTEEMKILTKNFSEFEKSATKDTATATIESAYQAKEKKIEMLNETHEKTKAAIEEEFKHDETTKQKMLQKQEEFTQAKIRETENEYSGILAQIQNKFPEIMDYIDESNGKILSNEEAATKKHERLQREKWNNAKVSASEAYSTLQNMGNFHAGQEEAHLVKCINSWKKYSNDTDSQIALVRKALEKGAIDKNTYQKEIDRLTANKKFAQEQIAALESLIKEFLETGMSVETLKRKIAELQSKTVTITTEFKTVGAPPSGNKGQMVGYNAGTFSLPTRTNYNNGTFALPKRRSYAQGTFSLPMVPNVANSNISAIVHDSSTGSHGEVMDLPGGTRIYPHDVSMRMARETAKSVAEQLLGALDLNNSNKEIIVPVILDGREIARVTAPFISNQFANNIRGN